MKTTDNQIQISGEAYIWVTNLLDIPRNDKKDYYRIEVSIFGIEVDTATFTTRLLQNRLERAIKQIVKALDKDSNSISYFNIQSLLGLL